MQVNNKRGSEYLGIVEFGQQLLDTGDLDPMYIAMLGSGIDRPTVCKFILGWMCYYHSGLAAWLAEQPDFFEGVLQVAEGGKEYPRGSQRVRNRGPNAVKSARLLMDGYASAEACLDWCGGIDLIEAGASFVLASLGFERSCSLHGFGPCMGWRIPDIQERLGLLPIVWVDRDIDFMYDNPRRGAVICCEKYGLGETDQYFRAHRYLMRRENLGRVLAPPRYERTINCQETETVFCKWKSHLVGRYEVGRDTDRSRDQLRAYTDRSPLARLLLESLPEVTQHA